MSNLPPTDSLHDLETQAKSSNAPPKKALIFTSEADILTKLTTAQKNLITAELKPLLSSTDTPKRRQFNESPMFSSSNTYRTEDPSYHYYCDRQLRWRMDTNQYGHDLLTRLVMQENRKLLELCCEKILKTKGSETDLAKEIAKGKQIYGEKKSYMEAKRRAQDIRRSEQHKSHYERNTIYNAQGELPSSVPDVTKVATWSDEEYKHLGFQFEYLKLKSLQRFTENYSLMERCWNKGLFVEYGKTTSRATAEAPITVRVVSLGGGPGFELFAFRTFAEKHFSEHVKLELISLDLEASWKEYAESLGNTFKVWDVEQGMNVTRDTGAAADFVMLSYVVYHYMNEPKHAEQFRDLLIREGTKALLVNSRVQTLKSVDQIKSLGIPVLHLIGQFLERDDRQVVYLNPEVRLQDLPLQEQLQMTFPNVPYEEHKFVGQKRKRN